MKKIEISNVVGLIPIEVSKGIFYLYSSENTMLFEQQSTKVMLGCTIKIPEGYYPLIIPNQTLTEQSCAVALNGGVLAFKEPFNSVIMKKTIPGKVRILKDTAFATLMLIKYETEVSL